MAWQSLRTRPYPGWVAPTTPAGAIADDKGILPELPTPPINMGQGGFAVNNWTGFLTEKYFSETGNWLTFLPLPEGKASLVGSLLMLGFLKKLSETEKGHELILKLSKEYLNTLGGVLEELHKSSVASPYIAAMNSYVAINIYKRLGLMSPNDATQCRAWIDHFFGEMLLTERGGNSLTALSTLVQGGAKAGAALAGLMAKP